METIIYNFLSALCTRAITGAQQDYKALFSVVHGYNSIYTVLEVKGAHENQNLILLRAKVDRHQSCSWIRELNKRNMKIKINQK